MKKCQTNIINRKKMDKIFNCCWTKLNIERQFSHFKNSICKFYLYLSLFNVIVVLAGAVRGLCAVCHVSARVVVRL